MDQSKEQPMAVQKFHRGSRNFRLRATWVAAPIIIRYQSSTPSSYESCTTCLQPINAEVTHAVNQVTRSQVHLQVLVVVIDGRAPGPRAELRVESGFLGAGFRGERCRRTELIVWDGTGFQAQSGLIYKRCATSALIQPSLFSNS